SLNGCSGLAFRARADALALQPKTGLREWSTRALFQKKKINGQPPPVALAFGECRWVKQGGVCCWPLVALAGRQCHV
ncbi:hypothetical protein BGZ67_009507, partial [Mortierella alpina]